MQSCDLLGRSAPRPCLLRIPIRACMISSFFFAAGIPGGGGAKSDRGTSVLTRTSALFIGRVTMEVGTLVATIERAVKTQMTPGSQCSCAVKIGQAIQTVTDGNALGQIGLSQDQIEALADDPGSAKFKSTDYPARTELVLVQRASTKGQTTGNCDWFQDRELPLYLGWERGTLTIAVIERRIGNKAKQVKWFDVLLGYVQISCHAFDTEPSADWYDINSEAGECVGRLRVTAKAVIKRVTASHSRQFVFDVKIPNKMFGSKMQLKFSKDSAMCTVADSGGKTVQELAFGCITSVDSESALIHLSYKDAVYGDTKRLTYSCQEPGGVAATVQAILHEYNVDVAIPFLITRSQEKVRDRAAIFKESSRENGSFRHSVGFIGDADEVLSSHSDLIATESDVDVLQDVSPAARLNCELLLANTSDDASQAVKCYPQQFADLLSSQRDPSCVLQNVRAFVDTISTHITANHVDINAAAADVVLEAAVIEPLHDKFFEILTAKHSMKQAELTEKRGAFAHNPKPQSYFEIPEKVISPQDWAKAIAHLNNIDTFRTPGDKLQCLVNTASEIYRQIQSDMQLKAAGASAGKPFVVSADEFTPIFVYVVFRSDTPNIYSNAEFMWELLCPRLGMGKGGYYLTQLSSALAFIDHELGKDEVSAHNTEATLRNSALTRIVAPALAQPEAESRGGEMSVNPLFGKPAIVDML